MGTVLSRVFGGKKEDSKTDVREPKHRKRWSFRAARRNDESAVSVPTRSSTLPARAHQQVQGDQDQAQTHESAEFEKVKVQPGQHTEFEEIDETTVANRVQEILKDVADDDDENVVRSQPSEKDISKPHDNQNVAELSNDVIRPAEASALVSAALGPLESNEMADQKLESHHTPTAIPEDFPEQRQIKEELVLEEHIQAAPAEESNLLSFVNQSHVDNMATEGRWDHDETKDLDLGTDEVKPVLQEQAQAISPDEHQLASDEFHPESNEAKEAEHELIEPVLQEQSQATNAEIPDSSIQTHVDDNTEQNVETKEHDLIIDEAESLLLEQTEAIHTEESNLLSATADPTSFEHNEPKESEPTEGETDHVVLDVSQVDAENPDNHIKPEEADTLVEAALGSTEHLIEDAPTDLEQKPIEQEFTEQIDVELVQDTQLHATPSDEMAKDPSQTESELESHVEKEDVANEENADHAEASLSANDEHPADEPAVGAFVSDILTEASNKVESTLETEPETELNHNEAQNIDHEQQPEHDQPSPDNFDNQFVDQLLSSVANEHQDDSSPLNDEFLGEKPEKILEKALNLNAEDSLMPNGQDHEAVANGYQE